ncbi:MAG: hypothetical protein ACREUT_09230 [Steroidobacteraceae bacterium]
MKASASVLFLAAALAGSAAYADCTYPQAPNKFPDGNTATLQDMLTAQQTVKQFDHAIKAYTDCLKLEHDTAVSKLDPSGDKKKVKAQKSELDNMWAKKNDAAVDQDTAVTNRFNEQVRIYKAKAAKGKS